MSGTVLDHRLVLDYLDELDAAMRGLPAAQAHELREQITAHLHDALHPDADDHEVAATLSRLGSPADLAAEAEAAGGWSVAAGQWGAAGSPSGLSGRRVRWRLTAVIAVPTVIAAVLGGWQISNDASNVVTFGRDQHLAQLNVAVVKLTQNLEDERDLSAAYVARVPRGEAGPAGSMPVALAQARMATDAAARTVREDAAGVRTGYQLGTVQDLTALLAGLTDLGVTRRMQSSSALGAPSIIKLYTNNLIEPANTFSAAVGDGINDAAWPGTVTTLAALLGAENELSVQRAILYAALSARPPVLPLGSLSNLQQAFQQEEADLADFDASADTSEQQLRSNTVSGPAVDSAAAQEALAEQAASAHPSAPLTPSTGLDAATWYHDMSTTIGDTRQVTDQLAGQLTTRANTLKANATKSLLLASIVTFLLLLLVLLISTSLARPLRKPRPDTLDTVTR